MHLEFGPSAAGQSLYYTTYAGGGHTLGGRCGIPPDAIAVAANVTVTNATASGSLRISLAGTTPTLETIDFRPGVTCANNAILGLFGTLAGNVTVTSGFSAGTADLVIDVTGWWR